jgi:PAS domain S-box-containing protein
MSIQFQRLLTTVNKWTGQTTQRRLVIWSLGFWLISIGILSIIFLFVGQNQLLNETRLRNTQFASTISRDVSAQLSTITGNTRTFTMHMAALGPGFESQTNALLGLRLSSARYRSLYYFDTKNNLLLNLSDSSEYLLAIKSPAELMNRPVTPAGAEIRQIYQETLSAGTSISSVYYTPLDYTPVIAIGLPVPFSSTENNIIVCEIDLTDIWQRINISTIGQTGITYAVSREGKVIAHTNPALIGRQMPDEISPIRDNVEGSNQFKDPFTGKEVIAAYSPVGGRTGWGIVVQQNRSEIDAAIVRTGTTVLFVMLILGIIGTVSIFFLIRGFTRPIKDLTRTAKSIARTGNLTKTQMTQRSDEVGQLSLAFDQMIDKVKETGSQLSISEERYRSLFEHANDAILLMDAEGILDCNRKAEEMFGASHDQIVHKLPSQFSPEKQDDGVDSLEKEKELMQTAFAGKELRFEWTYQRSDGVLFDAEVCVNRLNIDNRVIIMGMIRDITDRKRAEADLKQAQKEKEESAAAERTRLAHDLHDAVSQTLFSASIIADVLPRLWDKNPDEGRRRLEEIRQLTRGALAEMRTLLFELRPAALADAELGYLLHQLAESISGRSRIPVEVFVEGECDLPPEIKVGLYRITQEALNNVAKHAAASRAKVNLRCKPDEVTLVVSDNGKGFDSNAVRPESLGIGIMRDRAKGIGAELRLESKIGSGSEVIIRLREVGMEGNNER